MVGPMRMAPQHLNPRDGPSGGRTILKEGQQAGTVEVPEFKRILVAVDGSEFSMRAMAVAARMAKQLESELLIISVASPPAYPPMESGAATTAVLEASEGLARQALDRAEDIARTHGVGAQTELAMGPVRGCLLEAISKHKPDLLVLGNRGLSGIKRLWLGSVSEAMARGAGCNVLIVK